MNIFLSEPVTIFSIVRFKVAVTHFRGMTVICRKYFTSRCWRRRGLGNRDRGQRGNDRDRLCQAFILLIFKIHFETGNDDSIATGVRDEFQHAIFRYLADIERDVAGI